MELDSTLYDAILNIAQFVNEHSPQILTALNHDSYHMDSQEVAQELRQLLNNWREKTESFLKEVSNV